MAGQYGLAKRGDGTGGTTPADLQRVIGATYTNSAVSPIMAGGFVKGRSDMKYEFTQGVSTISMGGGKAIQCTWDAGTTAVVQQPSTPRVDVIWVNEYGVSVHPEGSASIPPNATILDKMKLPGGATSTSQATSVWNRNWALPYGSQVGWFGTFGEVHAHGTPVTKDWHNICKIGFWVPTDRKVDVVVQTAICSQPTDANLGAGSMQIASYMDGALMRSWEAAYDRRWAVSHHWVFGIEVQQGTHELKVDRRHAWGFDPVFFGGGPDRHEGGFVGIIDRGIIQ